MTSHKSNDARLVVFYGISTLGGYLMLNYIYIYIQMICK